MPFVEVADPKFDPEPQGFAAVDNPQFDAEPEQIGAGETFAQNLTNVFGGGPALVAAVNYVTRGIPYEQTREAYKQRMSQAAEQNPRAALAGKVASIVPETILGGAVGKAVGAGAKVAGLAERAAPFVKANPLITSILEGGLGGAGYGAASGAGEALSEGGDVGSGALKGAAGGAAVGGAFGVLTGGIAKAAKGAVERADSALVPGVTDAIAGKERSEVVSALRKDSELRKIASKPTAEALQGLEERASGLKGRADELIAQIDAKTGGLPIGKFAAAIDKEVETLGRTPLREQYAKALETVKDSALKAWVPEDLSALIGSPAAKESKTGLMENLLKRRDAAPIPVAKLEELTRDVTANLKAPEEVKSHVENILRSVRDAHLLDSVTKNPEIKSAADQLRDLDRDFNIISTITGTLKSRPEGAGGLEKLISMLTHGPLGAAVELASGHPVKAAFTAAKPLAKKGTELLAWLQREAANGNQKAIRAIKAAEAARTVGTAASGVVGSAQSGTLETLAGGSQ